MCSCLLDSVQSNERISTMLKASKAREYFTVFSYFKFHRISITFLAASNFSGTKGKIRRALNKSRNVTIVTDRGVVMSNGAKVSDNVGKAQTMIFERGLWFGVLAQYPI